MKVFLYGTLLDDVLRERLLGRVVDGVPATADGYAVLAQQDEHLPALVSRAGATATGICLLNCTSKDVARLDAYETAFDYEATEISVLVAGKAENVLCYRPNKQVQIGTERWSLSAWRDLLGPISRERAREIGQYDPPMTGAALRQQWHMITLRAGVRLRAAANNTPSQRRYDPQDGDYVVTPRAQLAGDFFKFAAFKLDHKTFHNERTGPLDRETIIACDAAIVLPYDPATDRVLLVEQIRVGPLLRGDANPWVLEPVAGMIDGMETPEEAALRETEEEAGLTDVTLQKMFAFYPSPGSTTDYFNCYLALGALPVPTQYTGGLAEEYEDLRLHVLSYHDAMALVDTGEINVGPLISMLFWLARHRDRLRAAA